MDQELPHPKHPSLPDNGQPPPADPQDDEGRDIDALSDQKLEAMWMMSQMETPPLDDTFTPQVAIEIIDVTRQTLALALHEIERLRHEEGSVQSIYTDLSRKFSERRQQGYNARQFLEDGGFWTVFAQSEQAVAFVPTRDDAVMLVHALAGTSLDSETSRGEPAKGSDPNPQEPEYVEPKEEYPEYEDQGPEGVGPEDPTSTPDYPKPNPTEENEENT